MLVVMDKNATDEQVQAVVAVIERQGYTARPIPGGDRVSIGVLNNPGPVDPTLFIGLPGVKEAVPITKPYKLVSRESKSDDTVVDVGGIKIGASQIVLIAGPCAIESEDQALAIAELVSKTGATIFRGGAFKPRTSPYSFQGLGEKGLEILARVRQVTGMPVVTEAMDCESFGLVEKYADMIQIGARNMQNFSLLKRAGQSHIPVLLKRGLSATVEEWLMAAEYILEGGNTQVVLCERGVRTFVRHSRNTLDLSAVAVIKRESHLPVIVDPSHAAGRRDQVLPLARAAAAMGCHGLMVEVHHHPEEALSDGAQSLYPDQFARLSRETSQLYNLLYAKEGQSS